MDQVDISQVLAGQPVRDFRWHKGQRHYSGWYFASTVGRLIAYESRLELARILLADFDGTVVAMASQPFQLTGPDGIRIRRHVPDLLLLHADGLVTVVDVKAPSRMKDSKVIAQFDWTHQLCSRRGWAYETWSGDEPAFVENVRFLAAYRRPHLLESHLASDVLAAARRQSTIGAIEVAMAQQQPVEVIRPVVLHLLWSGGLTADLHHPLSSGTKVTVTA
ncbi:TnsA-like heteromeric transposase endonuclease subunit [Streptomyces sp. NBC_00385]|uniref:TnsA-like heteromeric transposase endonuclease subunit n=1 Tax=Streptomyces sp. NBC_00385 TaxID=2975733 RepID=UPI002DDBE220|nr:TnsA-like heteromeric transposase endonuclease subunit [Streptomyces sp. NBC_00385]WRZ03603.1 TnsA-like heteromeric transposase endonuclease subunit [Streptomyces sp. NBC_00385]WRZ06923.1 TnsA-like heteromeric transposase endonuclease subunit [Streptomyces sp. NBC_00385]